jgi:hypothetical protein
LPPITLSTNVEPLTITLASKQHPFSNTIVAKATMKAGFADSTSLNWEIVDDQLRPAKYQSGGFNASGFDAQWKIPSDARWLNVSLTISITDYFEFLALPTRPN